MEQDRKIRWQFTALLLLLLGALCVGVRAYKIDDLALWADEVITLKLIEQNTVSDWLYYQIHDASPPLSYLIMKFWAIFSTSPSYLRTLPIVFSILTIIVLFFVIKTVGGFWNAIFASAIFTVHPFAVYYGREFRHPAISAFISVLVLSAFLRLIKKQGLLSFLLYFLTASLLLWTHYYAIFLIIPQLCALFFILKGKRLQVLTLGLSIGLCFLPWLGVMQVQWLHGQPREDFPLGLKATLLWVFYTIGGSEWEPAPIPIAEISFAEEKYFVLLLIFTIPFFISFIKGLLKKQFSWISFSLLTSIALSFLASLFVPIFRPKYFFMYFPLFCSILSAGLFKKDGKLSTKLFLLLTLIISLSLMQIFYRPEFERERWDKAARWIAKNASKPCAVAFYSYYPGAEAFQYYYKGLCATEFLFKSPYPQTATQDRVESWINDLKKNYDVIWLVDYLPHIHDKNDIVKSKFFKLLHRVDSLDFLSRRFSMFAFASTHEKWSEFISSSINFEKGKYLQVQLVEGVMQTEPKKPAWLAPKAKVILGYHGEDALYIKLLPPFNYLPNQELRTVVKVEGETVLDLLLNKTTSSYLVSFLPRKYNKSAIEVELFFDRSIGGSEDGSFSASAMISEIGLHTIGCEVQDENRFIFN